MNISKLQNSMAFAIITTFSMFVVLFRTFTMRRGQPQLTKPKGNGNNGNSNRNNPRTAG